MYFIDPDLVKNKNFYISELNRLNEYYKVPLYLFYGKELFEFLKSPEYWERLLDKWDCYEGWMVGNMVFPHTTHTIGTHISFFPQVDFAGLGLYNYGITKGGAK